MKIENFINRRQLSFTRELCKGEEGQFFIDKLAEIQNVLETMPKTYETDGKGNEAPVSLHYFKDGSDWFIIERDCEDDEQVQAFGFVCLNGEADYAELGYVSIEELLSFGAELDYHWTIKSLGDVKKGLGL